MTAQFQQRTLTAVFKKLQAAGFHPILRDETVFLSAEYGDGAADYYGEFHSGYPHIHPKAEKIAEQHGGYWEWENPGALGFYKA